MTPIPKPKLTPHLVRARYNIQLTSGQRAMRNRRVPPAEVEPGMVERVVEETFPAPVMGDAVAALPLRAAIPDEVDASFYAALRLGAMTVGDGVGEMPLAVAVRLRDAGALVVDKHARKD